LEEDLYADAQTLSPLVQFDQQQQQQQHVRVSPFRIVRVVDSEGRITSVRENAETVLECTRQGDFKFI